MVIISTSYLYKKDGYDYKTVFYRNNNDDRAIAVYFREVDTNIWKPLTDIVADEI